MPQEQIVDATVHVIK